MNGFDPKDENRTIRLTVNGQAYTLAAGLYRQYRVSVRFLHTRHSDEFQGIAGQRPVPD